MNEKTKEITMEFIDGKKLSESLDSMKEKLEVSKQIGINLAKLHDNEIIHGDLTTSNMILKDSILYFIDFGLGFTSKRVEDKAVDLHLIKEALEAKHFNIAKQCFEKILEGYKMSKYYEEVIQRLKKVESRGRYKLQY
jgi:N6-L-threonylcarbamoyladenine synthase/protein kinase Bud32